MKGMLIDTNYDIQVTPIRNSAGLITSGFILGNIDYQRCALIIEAEKGEFKEHPSLGFGIQKFLRSLPSVSRQRFTTQLNNEFKADNLKAKLTVGNSLSEISIEIS